MVGAPIACQVFEARPNPLPSPKGSCAKKSMFRPVPALTPQQGEHQEVRRKAARAASAKACARLRCRVNARRDVGCG